MHVSGLGIDPFSAASTVLPLVKGALDKATGSSPGGAPGAAPIDPTTGLPAAQPSPTTISPAFQQGFNAQVSPVIIGQIGSEGASATGAPTQQKSGGQYARGGGVPGDENAPAFPGAPPGTGFPSPFPDPFESPVIQTPQNYTPIITTGIIAAAAIAGLIIYNRRKGR